MYLRQGIWTWDAADLDEAYEVQGAGLSRPAKRNVSQPICLPVPEAGDIVRPTFTEV